MPLQESVSQRKIRSFSRRQGRLTQGQQFALENYWHLYCLDSSQHYDFSKVFGRTAPIIFEIGFGNGESLVKMALDNPDKNYIGVEVHRPGVGHFLMALEHQKITNVRVFCHDAIEVLEQCCSNKSLYGVHLFFPDPWPKRRHHKRRIVNLGFIDLIANKLDGDGYFHAATDWQPYAQVILENLSAAKAFTNLSETNNPYCSRPDYRPLTKFEQRGINLGHGVWDLIFSKNK
jgi:tRNA (guanine-N7-)-methyltransferase